MSLDAIRLPSCSIVVRGSKGSDYKQGAARSRLKPLFTIRKAVPADIPDMMALDRGSPTAAHWTENQYRDLLESDRIAFSACSRPDPSRAPASSGASSKTMLGFVVARSIAPEWEIENIVVAPSAHRAGVATALMKALLDTALKTKSEAVFLEVRESNRTARSFYEAAGFQHTGRRKSYYTGPLEDAILYRLSLP